MTDDNKFPAKVISLRDPANNVGEYNQVIINRGKDNESRGNARRCFRPYPTLSI